MPGQASRGLLLVMLSLVLLCLGRSLAQENRPIESQGYERPEAETIEKVTHEIATDPKFLPQKTFMQWLSDKLASWDRPDLNISEGVGRIIYWIIVIWCIGALIAILAHLIWTISLAVRPGRTQPGTTNVIKALEAITSPEQLWARSRELAGTGQFREAMGALLLALLRQLEQQRIVRFHRSKTNGEYVTEYRRDLAGHGDFSDFVRTFERIIYGGLPVARQTYESMTKVAERIIHDVSHQAQV